jgi:hypothetical protein
MFHLFILLMTVCFTIPPIHFQHKRPDSAHILIQKDTTPHVSSIGLFITLLTLFLP